MSATVDWTVVLVSGQWYWPWSCSCSNSTVYWLHSESMSGSNFLTDSVSEKRAEERLPKGNLVNTPPN